MMEQVYYPVVQLVVYIVVASVLEGFASLSTYVDMAVNWNTRIQVKVCQILLSHLTHVSPAEFQYLHCNIMYGRKIIPKEISLKSSPDVRAQVAQDTHIDISRTNRFSMKVSNSFEVKRL